MDKTNLDKKLKFINDYNDAPNASTGSQYDSNANVTSKNIATLQCELGKKDIIDIRRQITCNYLTKMYGEELANQYLLDLKNHIIYAHDESSLYPYCCSISLYPYLLNGLKDLGGTANAPKHANSFIGGMINLVFLVASQFAGAVAIPEFLTYFDHFLRLDFGDDYIDHLDTTINLSIGNRKETIRTKITDWFQQFVYSLNQPAGARNYQSPFTNIAYFDSGYFHSIFKDFVFPDGDEPCWETTKELQKIFMKWFNNERLHEVLTFPVETANCLIDKKTHKYKDEEMAQFFSEMWAEGHSFFMYQSDSADSLASCCRLKNGIEDNTFSYTLGAGGIETGSKCVITLNLNRITQNWYKIKNNINLQDYIKQITQRVHKYLNAWNQKIWDDYNNDLLPIYKAGFIDLDKQYLTTGINGFIEAGEFLATKTDTIYSGIKADPSNKYYQQLAIDILGTIEKCNKEERTEHCHYNLEMVPAENAASKLYQWDKKDGYNVPTERNMYNSYFYAVEDTSIDAIKKFYYQGKGFADVCSGGVALHNNLNEHLTQKQYRMLMDVAVEAGCNYWTYNIPNTICNECGYISKHKLNECPECHSKNIDYATRVIGYLKKVSNFSEARQEEAKRRSYFDEKHNLEEK